MLERETAKGPSRSQNARPIQQSDEYRLGEMIPQSVIDREVAQAAADFQARQEAADRLVRSGAADMAPHLGNRKGA